MIINPITYIDKCMRCNLESEYVFRSDNVNTILTDKDLALSMNSHVNYVQYEYCKKCNMHTKHERVAYKYSTKSEKNKP